MCVCVFTSLLDATARCRGVSHILSLALTRAPTEYKVESRVGKSWRSNETDTLDKFDGSNLLVGKNE